MNNSIQIDQYSYTLPDERIALNPLQRREDAKILLYQNNEIKDYSANDLDLLFPHETFIVLNETKVINARLFFKKKTGAIIEIFCLKPHTKYKDINDALQAKASVEWQCIIGNRKKWKNKSELLLHINESNFNFTAAWISDEEDNTIIRFTWEDENKTFVEILQQYGNVPLPPYINRAIIKDDEYRYQTVFAKNEGSVAAPTASLHLTQDTIDSLVSKGNIIEKITLHTGAGTFLPVKDDDISLHKMHDEYISFSKVFIIRWKNYILNSTAYNLAAIGTTACRTLETIYWLGVKIELNIPIDWNDIALGQWEVYQLPQDISLLDSLNRLLEYFDEKDLASITTRTQLLIIPSYQFRSCNILMTNFHQPKSTLLLLVAAFVGETYRNLYQHALDNHYRFLSYGDGSLLFQPLLNKIK